VSAGTGSGTEASGAASGSDHNREPARDASERDHEGRLAEASDAIVAGVARCGPSWVVGSVTRLVDAWGRLGEHERAAAIAEAEAAAALAVATVVAALRELFAADAVEQRTTPLQIVRGLVATPTAVLRAAGVPGVVRDAFEERAFPDDDYDLVPRTLGDLGDPGLGPLLLAWGLSKAAVLRARAEEHGRDGP
jgi:hypothetical protein